MKVCSICKIQFSTGIKYCSHKCAYKAIDIKLKQRKMKKIKPIFRKGIYKDYNWRVKLFRHPYPINNPENYVEAIFIQFGHRGFWVFRNYNVLNNWPAQA